MATENSNKAHARENLGDIAPVNLKTLGSSAVSFSVLVRRFCRLVFPELGALALCHQLHLVCRQRPGRGAVRDRPLALGLVLPIVALLSGGDGVGQAGNGDPVAWEHNCKLSAGRRP